MKVVTRNERNAMLIVCWQCELVHVPVSCVPTFKWFDILDNIHKYAEGDKTLTNFDKPLKKLIHWRKSSNSMRNEKYNCDVNTCWCTIIWEIPKLLGSKAAYQSFESLQGKNRTVAGMLVVAYNTKEGTPIVPITSYIPPTISKFWTAHSRIFVPADL